MRTDNLTDENVLSEIHFSIYLCLYQCELL